MPKRLNAHGFTTSALLATLVTATATGLSAQSGSSRPPTASAPARTVPAPVKQATPADRATFSVAIDLVTTDVVARDAKGNFVADLTKDEFEVYEDGVRQDVTSMTLSHGGRVTNVLAPPPPPPPEGVILPPIRKAPTTGNTGRMFVFFVDDMHLQFESTPRVREMFKKFSKNLVHEGDMFGIVSSGPSSISIQMTYDRKRLDEVAEKITGNELKPSEIINQDIGGRSGPEEIRYRAKVAMKTMTELIENLEKVHDRRKALVWVSDGYDFNPFQKARLGLMSTDSAFLQNKRRRDVNEQTSQDTGTPTPTSDPSVTGGQVQEEFLDADLQAEINDITRLANRANTTIYTIDPRGLISHPSIDELVDKFQWRDFVLKTQDSLRVLAEDTGGFAIVNQNDFDRGIKRIDADVSDYYILGYYSKNPDPTRKVRKIEVRVRRPGVESTTRKEYVIRQPPTASTPKKS